MMKIAYYPGCIPHSKTTGLHSQITSIASSLGIKIIEVPNWVCCGAFFTANPMDMLGSVRTLLNASKISEELVTTCALCYNVLKQVNYVVINDVKKRNQINGFLGEEYKGEVKVLHFLELLRDKIGFEKMKEHVKVSLDDLHIAPYYGCLLLRPFEQIKLDDPENPTIFDDFLTSLGCNSIDFPYKTECCGSYLLVHSLDTVIEHSYSILNSALTNGAEAIVVACPLCHFNIDRMQEKVRLKYGELKEIPIFYFTQLLAIALGIKAELGFDQHFVDPRPWLKRKGLIS